MTMTGFRFDMKTYKKHPLSFLFMLLVWIAAALTAAVFIAVVAIVVNLGRIEQRFGGNATLVEADAAQSAFLNDQGLETGRARTLGRIVAGRAAAENDQIVQFHGSIHILSLKLLA